MKFWLAMLLAWMAVSGGPVLAGSWRDDARNLRASQGQHERHDRGSRQQRDSDRPERFERREERRERPQRLSDDERRELHRDLDKAQREIYRQRRDR